MTIDLTGIQNENEFYSDHYLTTVFEGDIKETIERWNQLKADGGKAPHQEFGALAAPFIRSATEYRKTRDAADRVEIFRRFTYDFLKALGYERQLQQPILADGTWLPALFRAQRSDGTDHLWVVEALAPAGDDFVTDPLALNFASELGPRETAELPDHFAGTYEDAVTNGIFGLDQPPRFVLLLSMAQALLIDRNKWGESRLLRFDFTEIFSRKEPATMQAVTALLHTECLAPDTGTPLIDAIDEESHRHAHGVSKDLKYALREAIELLGNEAAEQIVARRKSAGETAYQTREGKAALDARQLSLECLRYMYRLLFLFYIEARPDLGFAPMKSDAYRKGYSLESLRELEMMPLTSDEEKDGHFLDESLSLLFKLVYGGTPYSNLSSDDEFSRDFDMRPVRTHLFDPDSTPMLSKVRFRNETLQRVIQLMSLSREGQGRRGRISYAQLGINQLGSVYEALLSYSGFFAQTDLYEVKKAGEANPDPLEAAYFVPKSEIEKYEQDEIVYDENDPRIYPKGTFIYRLAGRDREDSASYYTPEILTRCLVKYTLKELLKGKTADDILKLTICEPAMGSAAFLVEAVNQLTDTYLAKKQEELGERIPHDRYALERQKVRAYITDRNTFGVDFNPIAMELGQVTLWLNCIHEGNFVPWFGDQLFAGNSLIGARREVYSTTQLKKKVAKDERWFNQAPRSLKRDALRKGDEVYHFLLPDPNMADYKKDIVEPLAPSELEELKEWRKDFCAPLDEDEIAQLKNLSVIIDALFQENALALAKERKENTDPLTVWGQPGEEGVSSDFKAKDRRLAGMRGEGARNAVPYQRLKMAMDYWCALWLWPLSQVDLLPSRDEFLLDMTLILEGNVLSSGADMFERDNLLRGADPNAVDLFDRKQAYGQVDIQTLLTKSPRLRLASDVAQQNRFFHWPVELSDIFEKDDGFDFVLGNPPWMRPRWEDTHILAENLPLIEVRGFSAPEVDEVRPSILDEKSVAENYLKLYETVDGARIFLNSTSNYPANAGTQPNFYKLFIEKALSLLSGGGVAGLLHPEGHFNDPKGQGLRSVAYKHLKMHFQFRNQLLQYMFSDIPHRQEYGINIYRSKPSQVNFLSISNLFHPVTVDRCFEHDGIGPVPGMKDGEGDWELAGHRNRIINVDEEALNTFAKVMEAEDFIEISATRMPAPHSIFVLEALKKLCRSTDKMKTACGDYNAEPLWHETNDIKKTKMIRRETGFRKSLDRAFVSGPSFFLCNPYEKTPRSKPKSKHDFDSIDLAGIPEDYFPRSNFAINCDDNIYFDAIPNLPWSPSIKHTENYRVFIRTQIDRNHERTLKCAIYPPGPAHVNAVHSFAFRSDRDLLSAAALWSSLPIDYLAKASGLNAAWPSTLGALPWPDLPDAALHRTLQLNSLSSHYAAFWNRNAKHLEALPWTSSDGRLSWEGPDKAGGVWDFRSGLRNDFCRRQALIELDVLVAMALTLSLDELIQMYRVQFPVLQSYDLDTWYDQRGQIVFTNSKNLSGVGLDRKDWNACKDMADGTVSKTVMDDTMPGGPVERTITYHAPFTLPNREEDYERAWSVFEPKYASKAAA